MNKAKKLLRNRIRALSSVVLSTQQLEDLMERDFQGFSCKEGYELLRFLLVACGVSLNISSSLLNLIGAASRKDVHPDSKMTIERYKTDILCAVKDIVQKCKMKMKPLRKSDLVAPSSMKYFSCCLFLTDFALDQQLKKFGINISSTFLANVHEHNEFLDLYNRLKKQEMEIEEKNKILQIKTQEYLNETVKIINEINSLKEFKKEINSLLQELVKSCPLEYRYSLMDTTAQSETAAGWSKKLDEISLSNKNEISKLNMLDINLATLCDAVNGEIKTSTINGNDLLSLISPDVYRFAEENQVHLKHEDRLNFLALIKILSLSLPQQTLNLPELDVKLSIQEPSLLEKLKAIEEKVDSQVSAINPSLENFAEQVMVDAWINNFFTIVPEIEFVNDVSASSFNPMAMYIDIGRLEQLVAEPSVFDQYKN